MLLLWHIKIYPQKHRGYHKYRILIQSADLLDKNHLGGVICAVPTRTGGEKSFKFIFFASKISPFRRTPMEMTIFVFESQI